MSFGADRYIPTLRTGDDSLHSDLVPCEVSKSHALPAPSVQQEKLICTYTIKILFPALKIMLGDNRQPSSVKLCRQDCHIAALAE